MMVEMTLPPGSPYAGQRVGDVPFPSDTVLTGIIRDGHPIAPSRDDALEPLDELLFVTTPEDETVLESLLSPGERHPREVGMRRQHGLQQPPVAPARHPNDPHPDLARGGGLHRGDYDLRFQAALQLIRQPEPDASGGFKLRILSLGLCDSHDVRAAADAAEQSFEITLDLRHPSRCAAWQQRDDQGQRSHRRDKDEPVALQAAPKRCRGTTW